MVLAHPLRESLCGHCARIAHQALVAAGNDVELLDLAREGFDPRLSGPERSTYYAAMHDTSTVERETGLLREAETLVLVFPTWWFSPPALMKGFVDRVFAPGVAFDHGSDFGPIRPRLDRLRHAIVITTLGSPWWVDRLVMWRPVRRMFRLGVLRACAPKAHFSYLAFYAAEAPAKDRIDRFAARIRATFAR